MAKACTMPEQSPALESLLATLPADRFAEQPETMIIGMAYANRSRPDDQKYTATQIAQAVREAFPDNETAWTAQKIGKLVKSPEQILADLQTSQPVTAIEKRADLTSTAIAPTAVEDRSVLTTDMDISPQDSPAGWQEKLQRIVTTTEKHGARLLLEGMETGAYLRGDQQLQEHLGNINQELAGREDYRNGFLETAKVPAKVQTTITETIEAARARLDNAVQAGREREQHWKDRLGTVWKTATAVAATVAERAQQDWQVVQTIASPKLHETTRSSPDDDQAQQAAVIARLQQMAER